MPDRSFLTELKRRNVFRAALAYLVATWLLIQVAATVFPYVGLPDSSVTMVISLLAIGFVPTLILAWVFEVTSDGIKRERDIVHSDADIVRTTKKLDVVIILMLGSALAMFAVDRFSSPRVSVPEIVVTEGQPSIAVLPFENRSANADDVFFVDGVHDDILTSLAKIGSMKVISRTSVEQFKDTERTIPEIGDMLGVNLILEGGVQRAGDRIRINVQLIDARTDAHLWAETYNRELTAENIFTIQSEISNTIAAATQMALTSEEQNRLAVIPTENLEAYEDYMLGSQRLQRRTGAMIEEAVTYFQRAIDLDPNFALAHVGLADSYALLPSYANRQWADIEAPARAAAEKAIDLDRNLGEAYASLAMIESQSGHIDIAAPLFDRAIELSPNYATAHHWYGEHFQRMDDYDRALAELEIAVAIDPLSPIINFILGGRYTDLDRFVEAEASYRKTIEIDPNFARAYQGLALIYWQVLGRHDDAAIFINKARILDPIHSVYSALLANILISLGNDTDAEPWLSEAIRLNPENVNILNVSMILASVRDDLADLESKSKALLSRYAGHDRALNMLRFAYDRNGNLQDVLPAYEAGYPELLHEVDPELTERNYSVAIGLARIYQQIGQPEKATRLILEVRALIDVRAESKRQRSDIQYVQLLALEGRSEEAIAELRRHIESGWRRFAVYFLEQDSTLDSIHGEPEFIVLRNAVYADLAVQRESLKVKWAAEFE